MGTIPNPATNTFSSPFPGIFDIVKYSPNKSATSTVDFRNSYIEVHLVKAGIAFQIYLPICQLLREPRSILKKYKRVIVSSEASPTI